MFLFPSSCRPVWRPGLAGLKNSRSFVTARRFEGFVCLAVKEMAWFPETIRSGQELLECV
jgi:hypothetical protein